MKGKLLLVSLVAVFAAGVVACDEMQESLEGEDDGLVADEEVSDCPCARPGEMPGRMPPPMRRPPKEAFDVCVESSVGDACTVTFRDREIEGKCLKDREDETRNVCVPPPPPGRHHHRHGPPPEAFEACEGLQEEASCDVELPDRTVEGRCLSGPMDDAPMACVPLDFPAPPHMRAR